MDNRSHAHLKTRIDSTFTLVYTLTRFFEIFHLISFWPNQQRQLNSPSLDKFEFISSSKTKQITSEQV